MNLDISCGVQTACTNQLHHTGNTHIAVIAIHEEHFQEPDDVFAAVTEEYIKVLRETLYGHRERLKTA